MGLLLFETLMTAFKKTSVLNPLTLRNRVGEELADIFEANGIDNFEELICVKNLRSKENGHIMQPQSVCISGRLSR